MKLYRITETFPNGHSYLTLIRSQGRLYARIAFYHYFNKPFSYLVKQLRVQNGYLSYITPFSKIDIEEVPNND